MRGLLVSLTGLLLTACSSACGVQTDLNPPAIPERQWDSRLMPYVDEFLARAEAAGIPTSGGLTRTHTLHSITFGDEADMAAADKPAGHTLGVCLTQTARHGSMVYGSARAIVISDQFLTSLGTVPTEGIEADRLRRVVMHELTHCMYGAVHWGKPGDIQYASLSIKDVVEHDYEEAMARHFITLGEWLR